jgi:prolyl-tRNA editing enzyme YbaK/EbsC (Cys-tRNA(Pro) deacylase)
MRFLAEYDAMTASGGQQSLDWHPAMPSAQLLARPVSAFVGAWPHAHSVEVAEINPELADTAAFCATYGVSPDESANCVVVTGKREGVARYAACVVLASTRADVNGVVRRLLDVRKASFAAMDEAVALTEMEYGGITPLGLPGDWRIFVAPEVVAAGVVVVGSGLRRSKVRLPGSALLEQSSAELVEGLARPIFT